MAGAGEGQAKVVRTGPAAELTWAPADECLRPIDPPRPVLVSARAIDHGPAGLLFVDQPPPLRVRAAGLRVEQQMQGWQVAWVRMCAGQWRAVVTVDLRSANGATLVRGLTVLVTPEDLALPVAGAAGSA